MIVVTGLDGSGKSTLLSALEKGSDEFTILRVPHIDAEWFSAYQDVYILSKFLNKLGVMADQQQKPSLKIISMFGSMILYRELLSILEAKNKVVIAERHPLIDTAIYALAYLKVMSPETISIEESISLSVEYSEEWRLLLKLLPDDFQETEKGYLYDLLAYLYQRFSNPDEVTIEKLSTLFKVSIPEEIYFLDAPSEILFGRLEGRSRMEYHETEERLSKMSQAYKNWFTKNKLNVQYINVSDWTEVNQLKHNLISRVS